VASTDVGGHRAATRRDTDKPRQQRHGTSDEQRNSGKMEDRDSSPLSSSSLSSSEKNGRPQDHQHKRVTTPGRHQTSVCLSHLSSFLQGPNVSNSGRDKSVHRHIGRYQRAKHRKSRTSLTDTLLIVSIDIE